MSPVRGVRRRVARCRGDGGAATTELVMLTPLLFLVISLLVQVGLWFHAMNVAQAAAQEGARAARAQDGTAADGETRARDFLDALGPTIVEVDSLVATRDADTASVSITGRSIDVLPGLRFPIDVRSEGPVERFREP
jgi:Flp pilus assembly protein TadG